MANFVKGNYCWQASSVNIDMPHNIFSDKYLNMTLLNVSNNSSGASTYAHQQGRVKAANMHVGKNASGNDTVISFTRRVWNSGTNTWNIQADVELFRFAAGETGYKCSSLSESDTTTAWLKKDVVGFRIERVGPLFTGDFTQITFGICLEITEEERFDTSGTNR
jgi:hypothetical protein